MRTLTRRSVSCAAALVALIVLEGAPRQTLAQRSRAPDATTDVDAATRARFERGLALFEQAEYADARAEFAAGYGLSGLPLFLFNMAECARLAGDEAAARSDYLRYLEAEPEGEYALLARQRLKELGADAPRAREPAPRVPTPAEAARQVTPPVEPDTVEVTTTKRPREGWWSRRWPIVTAVGVAVVGGTVAAYAFTRNDGCDGCTVVDLR